MASAAAASSPSSSLSRSHADGARGSLPSVKGAPTVCFYSSLSLQHRGEFRKNFKTSVIFTFHANPSHNLTRFP